MKFLPALLLLTLSQASHARAEYIGRYAKYHTTLQTGNQAEVTVGTSELRVAAFNPESKRYTVVTTNSRPGQADQVTTQSFLETEFQSQDAGSLIKNCAAHQGTPGASVWVQNIAYESCLIQSSNTDLQVGLVPFSILRSVSRTDRQRFTTVLTEFHR